MIIGAKKIILFILMVLFFSSVIFVGEIAIFGIKEKSEEDYMEQSVYEEEELGVKKINYKELAQQILERKTIEEQNAKRKELIIKKMEKLRLDSQVNEIEDISLSPDIHYDFIPDSFVLDERNDEKILGMILNGRSFNYLVRTITLSFYEQRVDVRGKMKNRTIKFFGPQDMEEDELLGIFIHELSHYIDLYFLNRDGGADISNNFYDISWYSTIVLNPGLEAKDFVSGYAMTNKYEDFAETLTYYVFHNKDFLKKADKSKVLQKKYQFMNEMIFPNKSFQGTDFSVGNTVKNYYRDITKINFSKKKFLQYVKNFV